MATANDLPTGQQTVPVLGSSILTPIQQPTVPTGQTIVNTQLPTTPVTDKNGNSTVVVDEVTQKPWYVGDYANDYSAEINRIQKINPADPRVDILEKAKAEKVLTAPDQYPDQVQWANDIKSGTWNAENYKNDYQTEINRLQAVNPADPRIDKLEHLRAAKILASPSIYDVNTRDWAVNVDRRNWNANNYANDYQKEIDRIKAFDPNDPRIQELSNLRVLKILANPGGYDQDTVNQAMEYQRLYSNQLEQTRVHQSYREAQVQEDITTQKAIKRIEDYYQSAGLEMGGQMAADIKQAVVAGAGALNKLNQDEMVAMNKLIQNQQPVTTETIHQETQRFDTQYSLMLAALAQSGESARTTYDYIINNAAAVIEAIGATNYKQLLNKLIAQLEKEG